MFVRSLLHGELHILILCRLVNGKRRVMSKDTCNGFNAQLFRVLDFMYKQIGPGLRSSLVELFGQGPACLSQEMYIMSHFAVFPLINVCLFLCVFCVF